MFVFPTLNNKKKLWLQFSISQIPRTSPLVINAHCTSNKTTYRASLHGVFLLVFQERQPQERLVPKCSEVFSFQKNRHNKETFLSWTSWWRTVYVLFCHLFRSIGVSLPEVIAGWAGKESKLKSIGMEVISCDRIIFKVQDFTWKSSTKWKIFRKKYVLTTNFEKQFFRTKNPHTRFKLMLKYVIADRAAINGVLIFASWVFCQKNRQLVRGWWEQTHEPNSKT